MTTATQVVRINDFRGGLNLRADQMRLNPDESPDILDMDIDPRGGFRTRRPVDNINTTALGGVMHNPYGYTNSSGTEQLIVRRASSTLYYSTGGDFTAISGYTPAAATRYAVFDNLLYIQDGSSACQRWNGSARTAMGTSFSADKTAPTSDNVPIAKCIVAWQGRMWVANTTESSTAYPNRLRWSHPDKADAWAQTDAVEVDDGLDGDVITALLPFGTQLMIFKRHSVHILSGFPDDSGDTEGSLLLTTLTKDSGAPDQDSVASSPTRAFWWGWPNGIYGYDGSQAYWLFARIRPAIEDGRIPKNQTPCLEWYDGKLYVACGWSAVSSSRTTFVFDPSVTKDGAWTRYSLPLRYVYHWRQAASTRLVMVANDQYALEFEDWGTAAADDFGSGTTAITANFRTAWYDVNITTAKKRWRGPRIVAEASSPITIDMEIFHNYDDVNVKRHVDLAVGRDSTGVEWGTGTWSPTTVVWSKQDTWPDFVRVANLGTSNAVQMNFQGPLSTYWWQVSGIEIPYIKKRVR